MNKEASEMSESAYIYDDLDHSEMIESIINSEQIGTKIEILKMSIVIALKENPAKDYHKKMTTREDGAKNTSFSSIASEEIKILVEEYAKKEKVKQQESKVYGQKPIKRKTNKEKSAIHNSERL